MEAPKGPGSFPNSPAGSRDLLEASCAALVVPGLAWMPPELLLGAPKLEASLAFLKFMIYVRAGLCRIVDFICLILWFLLEVFRIAISSNLCIFWRWHSHQTVSFSVSQGVERLTRCDSNAAFRSLSLA